MARLEISEIERVNFLLRAHQQFPNDFFVNWYMATYAGGWSNAKEFALACFSLRPQNPAVLSKLGLSYLEESQYDRAIDTLEQLVKVAPWYHAGQFNLARAFHMRGDFELAEDHYDVSEQIFAKVVDSYRARIAVLRRHNQKVHADDLEKFLEDFRAPETVRPIEPSVVAERSQAEIDESNRLTDLIAERFAEIADEPNQAPLYANLAADYEALCELLKSHQRKQKLAATIQNAIKDFTALAELAPELPEPHERLADLCAQYGFDEQSVSALRGAIAIDPTNAEYFAKLEARYFALCTKHRQSRDQGQLIRSINRAIDSLTVYSQQSPPQFVVAHAALARFSEHFGRFNEAIIATERAVGDSPERAKFRENLGTLHLKNGRRHQIFGRQIEADSAFEAAVAANHEWVKSQPKSHQAYEQLAFAYKHQENFTEAMAYQKKVIELNPRYTPGRYRYAMLAIEVAEQQQQQGKNEDAINTLANTINELKEIQHDGFLMDLFDCQAKHQYKAGNLKKTIYLLRNVHLNRPGDHLVSERLARAYMDNENFEKAEKILLELKAVSPSNQRVLQLLVDFYVKQSKPDLAVKLINEAELTGVELEAVKAISTAGLN